MYVHTMESAFIKLCITIWTSHHHTSIVQYANIQQPKNQEK